MDISVGQRVKYDWDGEILTGVVTKLYYTPGFKEAAREEDGAEPFDELGTLRAKVLIDGIMNERISSTYSIPAEDLILE